MRPPAHQTERPPRNQHCHTLTLGLQNRGKRNRGCPSHPVLFCYGSLNRLTACQQATGSTSSSVAFHPNSCAHCFLHIPAASLAGGPCAQMHTAVSVSPLAVYFLPPFLQSQQPIPTPPAYHLKYLRCLHLLYLL